MEASGPIQEGALDSTDSEFAGPVQEDVLTTVANEASGPIAEESLAVAPTEFSGPAIEEALEALPAEFSGPVTEEGLLSLPLEFTGPVVEEDLVALPPPLPNPTGPVQEGSLSAASTEFSGPVTEETLSVLGALLPPILEGVTAVQRDSLQTYLVDVGFDVGDPQGADLTPLVEFARGVAGTFTPAKAQTFDRKHSVEDPITLVPLVAPYKRVNYVWNAFADLPEGIFDDVFVRVSVTNNPTTTVTVGPIVVNTTTDQELDPNLAAQLARRSILSRTPFDFLGNGIVIPFRRGVRDIVSASGAELIRSSVRQILGTRASVGDLVGELPWRPDFGSKLWVLRHRNNDPTLEGQAEAFVREALRQEPRVQVTDVFIERPPFTEPNELRVRVTYTIIGENVEDNNVILPEFEEEVVIGSAAVTVL